VLSECQCQDGNPKEVRYLASLLLLFLLSFFADRMEGGADSGKVPKHVQFQRRYRRLVLQWKRTLWKNIVAKLTVSFFSGLAQAKYLFVLVDAHMICQIPGDNISAYYLRTNRNIKRQLAKSLQ
jgi:hypothetical protein